MRAFFLIILLVTSVAAVRASARTDSLIAVLKSELLKKVVYDKHKEQRIKALTVKISGIPKNELNAQYTAYCNLYEEYKLYRFNMAYACTQKLLSLSKALKSLPEEYDTRIKLGFILASAGMFKETFDCLNQIDTHLLNQDSRQQYYSLKARVSADIADYDNVDYYSVLNSQAAVKYLDSAIAYSKLGSFSKLQCEGDRQWRLGLMDKPCAQYQQLLQTFPLTLHQRAMIATGLSFFYKGDAYRDKRIELLATAAICDIRSSTKETLAIFKLGQQLYNDGDILDAYTFVQEALENAQLYGSRLRTMKIGAVFPIIAAQKLLITEHEKRKFLIYVLFFAGITLIVLLVSFIVFNQLKRLKVKEKIIEDKNHQLEQINDWLSEDTRIKEEYIGNFFSMLSEYIMKLEKLKRTAERKIFTKKYDELSATLNEINIKKEREALFHMFDHIFLKIFPNFITVFNSLLKEEDQIWPKAENTLNTDIRIFALMRLGISNNQVVANILEYSVNTIYVYKMRVKAKAVVSGELFDHTIMSIKAVENQHQYNNLHHYD